MKIFIDIHNFLIQYNDLYSITIYVYISSRFQKIATIFNFTNIEFTLHQYLVIVFKRKLDNKEGAQHFKLWKYFKTNTDLFLHFILWVNHF